MKETPIAPFRTESRPQHSPEAYVGNPFLIRNALDRVDHEFSTVITILEKEEEAQGYQDARSASNPLLERFREWRDELTELRMGGEGEPPLRGRSGSGVPVDEGGMFND